MKLSSRHFRSTIHKFWMLRYVDLPEDIGLTLTKELRKRSANGRKTARPKHIPVVVMADGGNTRTTLVPAGGGRYRLQFNATLRKAAHADVGENVAVSLTLDTEPRALPIPL